MAEFTHTSGIGWTHNRDCTRGLWTVGIESTPTGPDQGQETATAMHVENIPYSITALEMKNGSLTMQGNLKAAVLVRMFIIGDPSLGDDGVGPGSAMIFNQVLNVGGGNPQNVAIPAFRWDNIQADIPVPANGDPYKIAIWFQFSGARWPQDAEFEFAGRWEAA